MRAAAGQGGEAVGPPRALFKVRVLTFVRLFINEHGIGPTLSEIQRGVGGERVQISRALGRLHDEGLIVRTRGKARGIALPHAITDALRVLREAGVIVGAAVVLPPLGPLGPASAAHQVVTSPQLFARPPAADTG